MAVLGCLVVVSLLSSASAASSSTSASPTTVPPPTKTSCPLHYITEISPKPSGYTCNGQGVLTKPDLLAAHCDRGAWAYPQDCYKICARDPKCVSFGIDFPNGVCYTYGKTLYDMGYKPGNKYQFFYNLKGCFSCSETPTPPRPSCLSPQTAKSPKPTDYTCGTPGWLNDTSSVAQFFISAVDADGPEQCYDSCARFYDPENACVAFSFQELGGRVNVCKIYGRSLREKGFKADRTSSLVAWNLRGCFECTGPPYKDATCSPTTTPVDTGVRNGNFSKTRIFPSAMVLVPADWSDPADQYPNVKAVKDTTGNAVAAIYGDDSSYGFGLAQIAYPQRDMPSGYFNATFDLAIPQHYTNHTGPDSECVLYYPGSRGANTNISAADSRYAGSKLKPAGPFSVEYNKDTSDAFGFRLSFYTRCPYGPTVNATFLVDNFRLTANGRDFARI